MGNLIDAIGGGLLGSDYITARNAASEVGQTVKNILGKNDIMYQAPYDHSLYGKLQDPILRKLPPSLRDRAKREMDMRAYKGEKLVKGFLDSINPINIIKGLTESKYKYGNGITEMEAAAGFLLPVIDLDGLKSKIPKIPVPNLKSFKAKASDPTKNGVEKSNAGTENLDALGLKDIDISDDEVHLEFTKDETYQDKNSGFTGYKVSVGKGRVNPAIALNDKDQVAGQVNESADIDKSNSLKFRPREDTLWFISLDKYTKGVDEGAVYDSALPDLPIFRNEFPNSAGEHETIDYRIWIPAVDYMYQRRTPVNAAKADYGWGHSFNQVSSVTRGMNFSLTLEDDKYHSLSRYAKDVINRSANYENATMTYWECLIHKITIFILDNNWRVREKFTLLGILQTDGSNRYNSQMDGKLVLDFDIVGEITDKGARKIETLESSKSKSNSNASK